MRRTAARSSGLLLGYLACLLGLRVVARVEDQLAAAAASALSDVAA